MINHIWTVVCSQAVIDIESNSISLQNVIEGLKIDGEPEAGARIMLPFQVVSLWERSDPHVSEKGFFRVRVELASGDLVNLSDVLEIDLSANDRLRTRVVASGFPAREAGRHYVITEFRVAEEQDWIKVAASPVTLVFVPNTLKEE